MPRPSARALDREIAAAEGRRIVRQVRVTRQKGLWLAWTDEADADGLTGFHGLQAMVAGACFLRLRPRRAEDRL